MNRHFFRIVSVLLTIAVLQACSAGGGETGTGETTQDTTVSVGVITGFGSVFVNGVEYETSSSTAISIDGANALESQLAVGMLVKIAGSVNSTGTTGLASSITFEDNVEGTVISNDLATGGALNVLGQNVYVDNDTIFENKVTGAETILTAEEVLPGQVVEVSGYGNGDGNIYATRIELKRIQHVAGETIELKGLVNGVNANLFFIGNMQIDFSNAELSDFDTPLQNNDFVEVKTTQAIVNNLMIASQIELKKAHDTLNGDFVAKEVEYEGVITAVDLVNNTFTLNTQPVSINSQTSYENGTNTDLKINTRIKLEGTVDENGVVVAKKIKFKEISYTKIVGLIESINALDETVTVLGYSIQINSQTRLKDDLEGRSELERQFFNFSDLQIGDELEISAYVDANNQWVASKLERKTPETGGTEPPGSTEWELKGEITSISDNTMIVKGISVYFSNVSGFVPQLNDNVEMKGTIENGVWLITEIEIKTEDDD